MDFIVVVVYVYVVGRSRLWQTRDYKDKTLEVMQTNDGTKGLWRKNKAGQIPPEIVQLGLQNKRKQRR